MKSYKPLWILMLIIATSNVWAYGSSSSSKKACNKPKFSEFVPANNAEVSAKSAFSFVASANTNPESIIVMIKDRPVAVTVKPINQGFQVTGTLPETLKGNFARISISADGPSQCKGSDGWLVKIIE
ncbi:MAG: hypothetical protein LUQ56_00070 [Methylococcaceae bacterium]|nr:hypothetical protein [Methylococcaceae bacterium]MDD1636522.1 hypothetical protein [Methylococcaceae bacterium]MDD1642067.1 hypothetical protein [Methylococcaceae bacterium]OYV19870.1 MAG: hypothetical protein CG441_604 [Methylococcaceae bacterium NSM2-1]